MSRGYVVPIGLVALFVLSLVAPDAQSRKVPGKPATLRTVDNQPDLQGVWTFGTMTPLERPEELAGKNLTPEEIARYEKQAIETRNADRRVAVGTDADVSKAYNQFWYESKRLIGTRTSLIVDPPEGRIPALTPEGKARLARAIPIFGFQDSRMLASWLDRGLWERCITRGLPQVMLPAQYNENYQIFQTRDYVVVHAEMIHDARIIPLDGRPHLSQSLRQWLGDSRGHWEGDTLVVDTRNFTGKTDFNGAGENLHLVERFRRADEKTLEYQVTIDDPTTFTRQWTIAFPARKNPEKMYEYACHEGNYAMANVLSGMRAKERVAAAKGVK
jgi:hypothetical protein